jgi:hypothetical protein
MGMIQSRLTGAMFRAMVCAVVATVPAFGHAATKCRNGNSILYTQESECPTGYTNISSSSGGSVSVIGKSENVKREEQDYLRGRAADQRKYQVQAAQEQQQLRVAESDRRYECNGLFVRSRSLETQMRQYNSTQMSESIRKEYQAVRGQILGMGC